MGKVKDDLGKRMKKYEEVTKEFLMRRAPALLRIDGRSFHTFTKGFLKPFDMILMECMWEATIALCEEIQGAKVGYTQSDEITIFMTDYDKLTTAAWFDYEVQKMVSVGASIATVNFNRAFRERAEEFKRRNMDNKELVRLVNTYERKIDKATFDARVFNLPKEEVANNFIWRQNDSSKNSIQMLARANFSHSELQNKNCDNIQDMLFLDKDINWSKLPTYQKRGACIIKEQYQKGNALRSRWAVDKDIPIFTKDRDYIDKYVFLESIKKEIE